MEESMDADKILNNKVKKNLSIDTMNIEILKYQLLEEEIGDTKVIENSRVENMRVISNSLFFEDEYVYMHLYYNKNVKKIKCKFTLTELNRDFVAEMISRVGLPTTDENIENYGRDPTLIEQFWMKNFCIKYNEIMKSLKKSKIPMMFLEKLKPAYDKTVNNEIIYS